MSDITGKTVGILLEGAPLTANATGVAVNLAGLEGNVELIVRSAAPGNSTGTLSLQLQTSADGSTSWQNVGPALAAFTTASGIVAANLNPVGCQQYIRAVVTVGGTGPSFPACVLAIGNPQYK
jgi:hypothetical protein